LRGVGINSGNRRQKKRKQKNIQDKYKGSPGKVREAEAREPWASGVLGPHEKKCPEVSQRPKPLRREKISSWDVREETRSPLGEPRPYDVVVKGRKKAKTYWTKKVSRRDKAFTGPPAH